MFKFKYEWDYTKKYIYNSSYITVHNSHVFISDWTERCIRVYKQDGTFIGVFDGNLYKFSGPGVIHVNKSSNQLIVPDYYIHCIHIYDLQYNDYTSNDICKHMNTNTYPRAVCCTHDMTKIFVIGSIEDRANSPSWFVVYNGRTEDKICEYSGKLLRFGNGMAWNNITREIFISDSYDNCIFVFDENANLKRTLSDPEWQFHSNSQLSIDEYSGVLFISKPNYKCIHMVRCFDGTLICNIYIKIDNYYHAHYIDGICYDSDSDHLYIATWGPSMQVFSRE